MGLDSRPSNLRNVLSELPDAMKAARRSVTKTSRKNSTFRRYWVLSIGWRSTP